jgi:hypothetical protein
METRRQVTIDGIVIGPMLDPKVLVHEQTLERREVQSHDEVVSVWVDVESRKSRADYGSAIVREAMAPYRSHWLRGTYERLAEVLEMNRDYILGAEGVAAIAETAEDRRLVDAIAAGATMDPTTGVIRGFDD